MEEPIQAHLGSDVVSVILRAAALDLDPDVAVFGALLGSAAWDSEAWVIAEFVDGERNLAVDFVAGRVVTRGDEGDARHGNRGQEEEGAGEFHGLRCVLFLVLRKRD